jgi:Ceramidase
LTVSNRSLAILVTTFVALAVLFLFTSPVPQDPAYHEFADRRTIFGVANFLNVMSNLPFLVIGLWGIVFVFRHGQSVCLPGLEFAYIVFFSGIFLTAFGSGYYHLDPSNDPLVWDRLPMTIGFAGLFAIIIGEFVSPRIGRAVVIPLLLIAIASVEYWAWTETNGAGDLRPYAVVQFLPMMLLPVILLTYKPAIGTARVFWIMLVFYVLAKLAEQLDENILAAGGFISGHSLKHIFAAMTPATLLYALMQRQALATAANDD